MVTKEVDEERKTERKRRMRKLQRCVLPVNTFHVQLKTESFNRIINRHICDPIVLKAKCHQSFSTPVIRINEKSRLRTLEPLYLNEFGGGNGQSEVEPPDEQQEAGLGSLSPRSAVLTESRK